MSTTADEQMIRAAFSPARSLEPTEAEVANVLSSAGETRRRGAPRGGLARFAAAGLATLVVLGIGGYAAAPPIRAAIDDATGTFADWLRGDSAQAPGRAVTRGDDAPAYFNDAGFAHDPRVIAEAGGYKLFVARGPKGELEFDLGNTGVGIGWPTTSDFREHAVYVLGPGAMQHADAHGHVPLFGITARSVKSVELTYESGPPLRVGGIAGGFVLLAQPERRPHEVIALGANGDELGRAAVDDSQHKGPRIDWSRYGR
jgi:hypothetical protein